jgi:cysteine desulfuration protein SufE
MTLHTREQQLIESLLILPDAQERLSVLVQRAAQLPAIDAAHLVEQNRVLGCVSQVWLVKAYREQKCYFQSAADSPLVAGLVLLLAELCDGAAAAELATFTPQIFQELGIWRNLSPTRQNGLTAVMQTIQAFANACLFVSG